MALVQGTHHHPCTRLPLGLSSLTSPIWMDAGRLGFYKMVRLPPASLSCKVCSACAPSENMSALPIPLTLDFLSGDTISSLVTGPGGHPRGALTRVDPRRTI